MLMVALSVDVSAQAKRKPISKKQPVKQKTISPAALPKVTQVDEAALKTLLSRAGGNQKPLLVNFWATWCGPCVDEFPDLVKIDNDYKGKIDFITVTLDDLADINTTVPKFLGKMNAGMPTFLLKTDDEGSAISAVFKDWQGGLPFTIFYDGNGAMIYNRQGKIVVDKLRSEIDKTVATPAK